MVQTKNKANHARLTQGEKSQHKSKNITKKSNNDFCAVFGPFSMHRLWRPRPPGEARKANPKKGRWPWKTKGPPPMHRKAKPENSRWPWARRVPHPLFHRVCQLWPLVFGSGRQPSHEGYKSKTQQSPLAVGSKGPPSYAQYGAPDAHIETLRNTKGRHSDI